MKRGKKLTMRELFNLITILSLGILLLVLFGVFRNVRAAETELTWTAPTQNCNGTSLTDLTGYVLTYGQAQVPLPPAPLSYTVKGLTPGVWWFSLAAVKGADSSEFVTVSATIGPEEFVTTDPTVYTVVKGVNRFLLLPVGTIPLGTVCYASNTVNGHYVVPRALVTWSGTVKPDVVVAKCL
jgi:hypothetical protein